MNDVKCNVKIGIAHIERHSRNKIRTVYDEMRCAATVYSAHHYIDFIDPILQLGA